jgi:dienelactone hydrolase
VAVWSWGDPLGPAAGEERAATDGAQTLEMLPSVVPVQDRRPPAVDTLELNLVDLTRPTQPVVWDAPALPWRALPTTVRIPRGDGPLPLVVFSHGLGSSPERFSQLLDAWAAAGYVVVAPRFPLTSDANPDHNTEVSDQDNLPADVSFVLDEVLAAAATPGDRLFGRVDPDAIGAAGFSLGGGATYALAYNNCCVDERIDSVAILGSAVLIYTGVTDLARPLPVLIVHSTTDEALEYVYARDAFDEVGGPAWFITVRDVAHHDAFDDAPTAVDTTVELATTAFWDRTLRGGDAAADAAAEANMALAVLAAEGAANLEVRNNDR